MVARASSCLTSRQPTRERLVVDSERLRGHELASGELLVGPGRVATLHFAHRDDRTFERESIRMLVANVSRKLVDGNFLVSSEHDESFDDVLELSHVPRPSMREKPLKHIG